MDVSQCPSIFPDPTTYPSIWVIRNHAPPADHLVSVNRVLSDKPELILQGEYTDGDTERSDIPQTRWQAMPEQIISPRLSDSVWEIAERTRENEFNPLDQKLEIKQCIRIGSAAKRHRLILSAEQYRQAAEQWKALAKPVIDGSAVERYNVRWPETYLLYILLSATMFERRLVGLNGSSGTKEEAPKGLLQETRGGVSRSVLRGRG